MKSKQELFHLVLSHVHGTKTVTNSSKETDFWFSALIYLKHNLWWSVCTEAQFKIEFTVCSGMFRAIQYTFFLCQTTIFHWYIFHLLFNYTSRSFHKFFCCCNNSWNVYRYIVTPSYQCFSLTFGNTRKTNLKVFGTISQFHRNLIYVCQPGR